MHLSIQYLPCSTGERRPWIAKGQLRNQFFYAWRLLWVAGKDRDKYPRGHWGLQEARGPPLRSWQREDLGEDAGERLFTVRVLYATERVYRTCVCFAVICGACN